MTKPPVNEPRLRRPVPQRTEPDRGILGVFGKSAWASPSDTGHPLGPGFAPEQNESPDFDFLDESLREASDLIDDHIRQGTQDSTLADDSFLSTLAGLYENAQSADLTALATQATRAYSDIAALWVDLASTLRAELGQMRAHHTQPDVPDSTSIAGPTLSIKTSCPVEARIEMFREGTTLTAQPLGSDDPSQSRRITEVNIADGRLRIVIPADQPAGTYYGLLIEQNAGPAGVVTVEVFAQEGDTP